MCNWFLKILILFAALACSTNDAAKVPAPLPVDSRMPQKILLFIPGYYGSKLKEVSSGKIRWAQLSNFLLSQKGLSQRIPGTQIGGNTPMEVDGILRDVKVLPAVWSVDSYGKSLEQLEQFATQEQMSLVTVAFDWRQDFIDCLNVVDQKIKSLKLNDNDELYIVSHSMGALLMSYYVRYGAQDVDAAKENWEGLKQIKKIALVAPPLHGLMILFRDIGEGTSVGLNRTLLSDLDYSTFKSSYFFLPPSGEDIALNESKEKVALGIHDVDKWKKNNWGPFKFAKASEHEATYAFVKKSMTRSEKFHALLRAPIINDPPKKLPLLHMRGLGHKTKEYASLKMKDDILTYTFEKEGQVDGDGTVTARSGIPLEYFKAMDFTSRDTGHGHLDILALPESQNLIHEFFKK